MTLDINHLRQWIGRTEELRDVVTAAPLACLQATLDRDDPDPEPGDALPPSAHWLYFLAPTRQSDLDANGHATQFTYNAAGRLASVTNPLGDTQQFTYDAAGHLARTVDAAQQATTYTYDAASRLTTVDDGTVVTHTWDANGNLLDDGASVCTYTRANRLAAVSGQSSVFSFQYNGLGDRLSQTVDGMTTNYTLDLATGLTQVLVQGTYNPWRFLL